jgi:uncharacterized membrane protein YjjP (DUF1212 family)
MAVLPKLALELLGRCAKLLFGNGQTTYRVVEDLQTLSRALGYKANVYPSWDQITIELNSQNTIDAQNGSLNSALIEVVDVSPLGVDMNKVSQTLEVMLKLKTGKLQPEQALVSLDKIATSAPASTLRFTIMAGLGACALAVIFGATDINTLLVIMISACAGALLRRMIAHYSHNALLQPLAAACLSGVIGAIAQRLSLSPTLQLIAVCPCMILVPGAHIINGSLDMARVRISLGIARLAYSALIILMICIGLLLGLYLGGQTLAQAVDTPTVPLIMDVLSAGIAVAAFGAFFSMSWRVLIIPIAIGMFAHAMRWAVIDLSSSVVMGAFAACLFAGLISTPLAHRFKLPFAALAFASVVSMMPGVFIFRMTSALISIYTLGEKSSLSVLTTATSEGITATMICLAIAFGLILPKITIDRYCYNKED